MAKSITKLFDFESQSLAGIYQQKATARLVHGWKVDEWGRNIED